MRRRLRFMALSAIVAFVAYSAYAQIHKTPAPTTLTPALTKGQVEAAVTSSIRTSTWTIGQRIFHPLQSARVQTACIPIGDGVRYSCVARWSLPGVTASTERWSVAFTPSGHVEVQEMSGEQLPAASDSALTAYMLASESPTQATCSDLLSSGPLQRRFFAAIAAASNNSFYTQHGLAYIARDQTELACGANNNARYLPWSDVLAQTGQTDGYMPGDPTLNGPIQLITRRSLAGL